MAGVGKLLKQAQKMQRQMQAIQEELAEKEIEVSSGGGAVQIKVSGQGEFHALKLDPEFLKEDAEFIEETVLSAIREAAEKAKAVSEEAMGAATGGMGGFPGLM
jgi:DNA-binding YbaB/EbfC family protein